MLTRSNLHKYQKNAVEFIKSNPRSALFLDMGLGKTISALTAVSDLLKSGEIKKILLLAPLRVCHSVWEQEACKWEHTKSITFAIGTGSSINVNKAIKQNANITIINVDNVAKLAQASDYCLDYDMLIIDESSTFKSPSAKRFKFLRKALKGSKVYRRIILTGTPSPNSLADLWSQYCLLDEGKRLYTSYYRFIAIYFNKKFSGFGYEPRPNATDEIVAKTKDITLSMLSKDYIDLPKKINIFIDIELPKKAQRDYKELENEFVLFIKDNDTLGFLPGVVEAKNAAVLANKLLQICNGAVYDNEKNANEIHDLKIKELKQLISDNPSENFFVAVNYITDFQRIMKAIPQAISLKQGGQKAIDDWNAGKIRCLIAHPKSAGHGLNLQAGGNNVVWFGLNWSLELYQQFNARLLRQGQTKPVKITHLVAKNCIDEKVLKVISNKNINQSELLNLLKK